MTNSKALKALRAVENELMIAVQTENSLNTLVEEYAAAVDHIDSQLPCPHSEYEDAKLTLLIGRVARKMQISVVDARGMVFEALGENATACIVCGLLLEIEE